jgi:5-(carboxyamino)imidazole ribonucleotide synthase
MQSSTENKSLPLIGILGDGQLSKMMIEAYHKLGGQAYTFGQSENSPASTVSDKVFIGNFNDLECLVEFFKAVDIVTLENEFIDSELLIKACELTQTKLYPDPNKFKLIEDKLSEKRFFKNLDIEVAEYFEVHSEKDLKNAAGFLKLAKGGYDGKGTYFVKDKAQAIEIYNNIKDSGKVLFEYKLEYRKELSMIAASNSNDIIFYPMVATFQENGTCRYVSYPARVNSLIEAEAKNSIKRIMNKLNTRGLFAFEFFLTKDNRLILNESAPRPHNSGHITMDIMTCSQFENHMRAVADLELLRPCTTIKSALMLNLLGTRNGSFDEKKIKSNIFDSELAIHLYGKEESRINRKMGHITLWGTEKWERAKDLVGRLEI